jgi:hypothetical protein
MFTDAELITVCQLCSHPPTAHVAMTINNSKGVCTLCNSLEQEKKVPQYQPQSVDYAGPADEAKMSVDHGTVPFLPTEPSRQSGTQTPAPGAARETRE